MNDALEYLRTRRGGLAAALAEAQYRVNALEGGIAEVDLAIERLSVDAILAPVMLAMSEENKDGPEAGDRRPEG